MNNVGSQRKQIRILNIGSLNIDSLYRVEEIVREGATISADSFTQSCGGKGLNQSIAAARAGASVWHAGVLGKDGALLRRQLQSAGVQTEFLLERDIPSGHAIIQLDKHGNNCIIVYKGSNGCVEKEYVDQVLAHFSPGDYLLAQNETSNVGYMIRRAHELGLVVFFNPSPISDEMEGYPIEVIDYLLLNEVEGRYLSGKEEYEDILYALKEKYPNATIVLTIGKRGALCLESDRVFCCGTLDVPVVDTTGAGDTFCGYFAALLSQGQSVRDAVVKASIASNFCVTEQGASDSVPFIDTVEAFYRGNRRAVDRMIAPA